MPTVTSGGYTSQPDGHIERANVHALSMVSGTRIYSVPEGTRAYPAYLVSYRKDPVYSRLDCMTTVTTMAATAAACQWVLAATGTDVGQELR